MNPVKARLQRYYAETAGSSERKEQPLAMEQALALDQLSTKDVSSANVQRDLSDKQVRWLSRSFSQAFNLPGALKRAGAANEKEKCVIMRDAAQVYESFYEQMTFWEMTSFWALVMSCSPCSLPMALEAKHINKIAWLSIQQIHQKEDKIEIISLIHVLGTLVANRQLKIKAAGATRTMDLCTNKLLAELVFLFAQSLKPEEGKKWYTDRLSFMTLFLQQIESAYNCSIYHVVDMLLTESLDSSGLFTICIHLIAEDPTLLNVRALGHFLLYGEYEVPPGINPSLWKCAKQVDLTQLDEDAIKELLAALFHGNAPREKGALDEPVAFLQKWPDILCQRDYQVDVRKIMEWLHCSAEFPIIWQNLKGKYKDFEIEILTYSEQNRNNTSEKEINLIDS